MSFTVLWVTEIRTCDVTMAEVFQTVLIVFFGHLEAAEQVAKTILTCYHFKKLLFDHVSKPLPIYTSNRRESMLIFI